MSAVIHAFHRRTESVCPVCGAPMYLVFWYNSTKSLMCLKCHFGFNYAKSE